MAETFQVGDTVRTTLGPVATKYTVAFGPFRARTDGPERYMVQKENGTAVSVLASDMHPYVMFTIGEEAEERAMGRTVVIEAGPFKGVAGQERYVVKFVAAGHHAWVAESGLRKRPQSPLQEAIQRTVNDMAMAARAFSVPQSARRSYVYAGRTYSLDGEYEDRQGDVWRFNGQLASDGMPLMDCPLHPALSNYRLSEAVNSYGPLSRA